MKALTTLLTDIADAIRAKKGTADLIAPVDFALEINNLPEGGGDSGGVRSSWRYFDVSKIQDAALIPYLVPSIVRIASSNNVIVAPFVEAEQWVNDVVAVGVDGDEPLGVADGRVITWNEGMVREGLTPEVMAQQNIIEITEDEFLNNTFTKE